MQRINEALEYREVVIYFAAVVAAAAVAHVVPGTTALEPLVDAALVLMLYLTFLQVPMSERWPPPRCCWSPR